MKLLNEHVMTYPNYAKSPKAVIAAVAWSLALRMCEDDPAEATKLIESEWKDLHENGIVPQEPIGCARTLRATRTGRVYDGNRRTAWTIVRVGPGKFRAMCDGVSGTDDRTSGSIKAELDRLSDHLDMQARDAMHIQKSFSPTTRFNHYVNSTQERFLDRE